MGDLLPVGGGEQLASLHSSGLRVRHADINAAQGIGVRSLDGHIVPFRVSAFAVPLANGLTAYVNKTLGKRLESAFGGPVLALLPASGSEVLYDAKAFKTERVAAAELGLGKSLEIEAERELGEDVEDDDLELAVVRDQELELSGERKTFFRDPSRQIHGGRWVEAKIFWGAVCREVTTRLRASGRLHG